MLAVRSDLSQEPNNSVSDTWTFWPDVRAESAPNVWVRYRTFCRVHDAGGLQMTFSLCAEDVSRSDI